MAALLLFLHALLVGAAVAVPGTAGTVMKWFVGWPILFLPGYGIYYLFYRRSLEKFDWAVRALFYLVLSFAVLPIPLLVAKLFGLPLKESVAANGYAIGTILLAVSVLVKEMMLKKRVSLDIRSWLAEIPRWFWIASGAAIAFLVLNMVLYRYLPEADPYGWAQVIRTTERTGAVPVGISRVSFVYMVQLLTGVTGISTYWLFKVGFPVIVAVASVLFSASLLLERKAHDGLKVIMALSLVALPVFTEEALVSRPQTIAILLYLAVLPLLATAIRARQLDVMALATVVAGASFRYHELNAFLLLICAASILYSFWDELKKSPRRSAFLVGVILLLGIAAIAPTSVGSYALTNIRDFAAALRKHEFRLWFIGHYVNSDGIEVGWPGTQAILYYVYNLGVMLPFLLLAYLGWRKRDQVKTSRSSFPFIAASGIFLMIAEGLPRLGFYPLPDRAWIFLSIALLGWLMLGLDRIGMFLSSRRVSFLLVLSLLVSLAGSIYITYAKQGRVSADEFAAGQFLAEHTKPSSVVISQDGNRAAIEYFGDRKYLNDDLFFAKDVSLNDRKAALGSALDPTAHVSGLVASKNSLIDRIIAEVQNSRDDTASELRAARAAVSAEYAQAISVEDERDKEEQIVRQAPEFYVMFSTDKFKGLSATRQWWKDTNYSWFDPASLTGASFLQEVYRNDAVIIWKILQTPQS